ncbi:MAG TPA: TetR/AcrR family transcriptional regulator [Gemmatimonadales bacterium]|nr:TetR/AcrR family transcriptional regulator [Gemmatimonadales bacterium]
MTAPPTPDRLRLAARRLFAEQGYAGTSIRQIVRRAGANLGAVTYHFGGKQRLYHAVLAEAIAPLVERVTQAAEGPGSPVDRLEAVMRAYFTHLDERRDLPALISREMAQGRPLPPPMREAIGRISQTITGLVADGQAEGLIPPGPPLHFGLSLLAQPIYFALVRPGLARFTEGATEQPAWRAALIEHAVAFARRGLEFPVTVEQP